MRKFGNKNDWWDWGVILLIVAAGTIVLWAGVWAAHFVGRWPPSGCHGEGRAALSSSPPLRIGRPG